MIKAIQFAHLSHFQRCCAGWQQILPLESGNSANTAAKLLPMWAASPKQILAARQRIDPVFLNMPLLRSAALNRRFCAELVFKNETANPIRSFKGRGACNLLAQTGDVTGVVAASAGNFGQGMAWAARLRGWPITVFAPKNAVASKIEAMRRLGARVILEGTDFDAAKDAAAAHSRERDLFYVEDGAHAPIAEGAGTLAMEMVEEGGPFDTLLTPLGNGALAAGLGCWVKHVTPEAEVVAVSANGAPAMAKSVKEGVITTTASTETIADGIAVRVPIPSAVSAVRQVVDDVILVSDDDLRQAMQLLRDELEVVVEPAGAAGFAAIIADPGRWRGRKVAMPLCGGNV